MMTDVCFMDQHQLVHADAILLLLLLFPPNSGWLIGGSSQMAGCIKLHTFADGEKQTCGLSCAT